MGCFDPLPSLSHLLADLSHMIIAGWDSGLRKVCQVCQWWVCQDRPGYTTLTTNLNLSDLGHRKLDI